MTEIETLTEQEHAFVTRQAPNYLYAKLVRIHDAQAKRIAELEASMQDLFREAGRAAFILGMPLAPLPTCRICGETRFSAGSCEECGATQEGKP